MKKGRGNEKLVTFEKVALEKNQPFGLRGQKIGRTALHWHEGITEIVMVIRGEVLVTAGFEIHDLKEGEFTFVNHRSVHSLRSEQGAAVLLIHVNHSCFAGEFPDLPYMFFRSQSFGDPLTAGSLFQDNGQEAKRRFRHFLRDLLRWEAAGGLTDQDRHHLGNRLVYEMVFEFNWFRFLKSTEGLINSAHMERYHRIVKYIQEHSGEKISLKDAAAGEYITKTYLSQFWKKFSRYSFTERVNYERILKSEFMLLSGHNILRISEHCGFSDVKYYYRNFRKWFGCLPTEHRKRCREYYRRGVEAEEISPSELYSSESADRSWEALDEAVRVSHQRNIPIAIPLLTHGSDLSVQRNEILLFLEDAGIRYGKEELATWQFHIRCQGIEDFDKSLTIEGWIRQRVSRPTILRYYEAEDFFS